MDDPFVSEQLKNVCSNLTSDLRKKPRRLKKRVVRGALRVKRSKNTKKRKTKEALDKKQVDSDKEKSKNEKKVNSKAWKKKNKGLLDKRAALEADKDVYGISDSDEVVEEIVCAPKEKKRRREPRKDRSSTGNEAISKPSKRVKTASEKVSNGSNGYHNGPLCEICWTPEMKENRPDKSVFIRTGEQSSKPAQVDVKPGKSETALALKIATDKPSNGSNLKFTLQNPDVRSVKRVQLSKCCGCKRNLHVACLESHINKKISGGEGKEHERQALDLVRGELSQSRGSCFDSKSNLCINCRIGKMDCFECGSLGNMKTKIESRTVEMVRDSLRQEQISGRDTAPFEELGTV